MIDVTGQRIFYQAMERAGLRDKGGIHALRHSFATHLLEAGVEITVVQRLLGHAHLNTTSTYLHVRQERLAQIAGPLQLLDLSQRSPPRDTAPHPGADPASVPGLAQGGGLAALAPAMENAPRPGRVPDGRAGRAGFLLRALPAGTRRGPQLPQPPLPALPGRSGSRLAGATGGQALLPVPYFHLVFTLPHCLNGLIRQNRAALFKLLFDAATQTLLEFGAQRLEAQLGITAVLHTWSQTLGDHYHLHCIVTGGGVALDPDALGRHLAALSVSGARPEPDVPGQVSGRTQRPVH